MSAAPRLYFSFRSPYSWLAIERLRARVPDLFSRFTLVPYWDPDPLTAQLLRERGAEFHYQQMSRPKHRYLLLDAKRMAARLGLPMAWPIDVDPWWELPHLGWLAARQQACAQSCYDALVAARWQRGEDICTSAVFARVIAAAGLDAASIVARASTPEIREEGVAGLVAAYEDDVFGIPYLRWGRQRFWGLDRVDMFLEAFTSHPPAEPVAVPPVPIGSYDRDTAGGCG